MVDRRAAKQAPATRPLVIADLGYHRDRLDDEDPADDEQHQLLPRHDGYVPDQPAKRQRPGVAHEHARGVTVVPEEAQA